MDIVKENFFMSFPRITLHSGLRAEHIEHNVLTGGADSNVSHDVVIIPAPGRESLLINNQLMHFRVCASGNLRQLGLVTLNTGIEFAVSKCINRNIK